MNQLLNGLEKRGGAKMPLFTTNRQIPDDVSTQYSSI
jgi:hypothetical protein